MTTLFQDVRYGLRMLRKSPGFTAVAIITLALGIGANTAIFSLINAIMLRTLPVKDPQRLVVLKWRSHEVPKTKGSSSYANCPQGAGPSVGGRDVISDIPLDTGGCSFSFPFFQQIRSARKVFSHVAAFVPRNLTLNSNGRTSPAQLWFVSSDFFPLFEARPERGRLLNANDGIAGAPPVIVVSHRFWQNELGGDQGIVGKRVRIGKALFSVAGVVGPKFPDLDPGLPVDLWLPIEFGHLVDPHWRNETAANAIWLELLGRLQQGVTIAQARSAASTVFAANTTNGPEAIFKPGDALEIELASAAHGLATLRRNFSQWLFAMLAAVGIVLLISCANIAGLMLARSAARQKELATCMALGATPGRIVRQLLTESLILSLAGGGAGIILGYWNADALAASFSRNWSQILQLDVHPDLRILAFTAVISVLVGIIFGIAPAFLSGRADLAHALRGGNDNASSGIGGRKLTLGNVLVLVQIALAMLVLTGAGLVARTLKNLKTENVGFDPQNLVVFRVDATYRNQASANASNFYQNLQETLAAVPGVSLVSHSGVLPLNNEGMAGPISSSEIPNLETRAHYLPVSDDFFKTMRMPLLAGRSLEQRDAKSEQSNGPTTVVVNEMLARRIFGTPNVVGRRFRMGGAGAPEGEIVGVVGDGKYDGVREDIWPTIYTSVSAWDGYMYFEVRTGMDPAALMNEIRAAITRFDSNLLVAGMRTGVEQIDQNIYQERLIANLSSLFALLALIVACVGIYGLLSYQVTRRTHEIGIRLALGAQRGDVLSVVMRQGAILAVSGILIGTGTAFGLTRYLQSFLFGVKPSDPLTIAAVAFLLISVALLASYIPARRAMKTDAMVALRYE